MKYQTTCLAIMYFVKFLTNKSDGILYRAETRTGERDQNSWKKLYPCEISNDSITEPIGCSLRPNEMDPSCHNCWQINFHVLHFKHKQQHYAGQER